VTGEQARLAWLDWLARERRASGNTREAYGADAAGFLGFLTHHLGGEPDLAALGGLRAADLRGFLAARAAAGDSTATRARRLAAIRGFLRYLTRHHGMAALPLGAIRGPRPKPPIPRALTAAQARAVASEVGEVHSLGRHEKPAMQAARDTALFALLYGAGLRIAEALAIDLRDAPLPGNDAALRVIGKGAKQRLVPVLPVVRAAVAAYLRERGPGGADEPLFLGARGWAA
jgi:integrase/recombinase XerC